MFKEKYFSLVMAMSLVVNMFFPFSSAKAAYDAQYDISSGNVAITANGSYRVYGTTASNTISVSSGLTNVSITLDNVSIALGSTKDISPILINGNSQVTINLSGSNILTCLLYTS
ncbi:MAG: carbohydrate-binding domain-containing protein, partial [Clostridia bacterium]|nr:carbohydrate-binding domain-containing protein [Clostridia bacterium]